MSKLDPTSGPFDNPCGLCGLRYDYAYESCPNCTFNRCSYCFHEWHNCDDVKDRHEKNCYWYDKTDDDNAFL